MAREELVRGVAGGNVVCVAVVMALWVALWGSGLCRGEGLQVGAFWAQLTSHAKRAASSACAAGPGLVGHVCEQLHNGCGGSLFVTPQFCEQCWCISLRPAANPINHICLRKLRVNTGHAHKLMYPRLQNRMDSHPVGPGCPDCLTTPVLPNPTPSHPRQHQARAAQELLLPGGCFLQLPAVLGLLRAVGDLRAAAADAAVVRPVGAAGAGVRRLPG